jgi:hypothetical protein
LKTFLDFRDDRVRLFFPGIVGSDDAEVGILIRDTTINGRFLRSRSPASEDDNEFTRPRSRNVLRTLSSASSVCA